MVSKAAQFEQIVLVCPSPSLIQQLGDWARKDTRYALCLYPASKTRGLPEALAAASGAIIDATETVAEAIDALQAAINVTLRPILYTEAADQRLKDQWAARGATVLQGPLDADQWTRVFQTCQKG